MTLDKIKNKIANSKTTADNIQQWKQLGETVVFTNGCFDILHEGHVTYLSKAADYGNKLVIGVNTDSSVKRLKGEKRPINNEQQRALVLAALGFVDSIVFFDDDTPQKLIEELQPDVLVKGNDYKIEEIAGAAFIQSIGGKVATIPLVKNVSTTEIIQRINDNCQEG